MNIVCSKIQNSHFKTISIKLHLQLYIHFLKTVIIYLNRAIILNRRNETKLYIQRMHNI